MLRTDCARRAVPDVRPGLNMVSVSANDTGTPLVSVIIPAYNARPYVMDAIRSVRAQGHAPLEILLIDDGSSDGTAELVAAEAPEVRIIRQSNGGVAAARNRGLREASGEFITFLDADDGWFPGKLHAQIAYLQAHPSVGVVFHRWLVWRPDAEGVYHWPSPPSSPMPEQPELSGWLYLPLLLDCVIHTSTVMIRRSLVDEIGLFDTTLTIGEDYDYWLRASQASPIHKLAPVYSFYRSASESLTSAPKDRNYEYLVVQRALERWGAVAPDGKTLPARALGPRLGKMASDFGYAHYYQGSSRLAFHAYLTALRHQPGKARNWLYLLRSMIKATIN